MADSAAPNPRPTALRMIAVDTTGDSWEALGVFVNPDGSLVFAFDGGCNCCSVPFSTLGSFNDAKALTDLAAFALTARSWARNQGAGETETALLIEGVASMVRRIIDHMDGSLQAAEAAARRTLAHAVSRLDDQTAKRNRAQARMRELEAEVSAARAALNKIID